jgi:hypothetical protein
VHLDVRRNCAIIDENEKAVMAITPAMTAFFFTSCRIHAATVSFNNIGPMERQRRACTMK